MFTYNILGLSVELIKGLKILNSDLVSFGLVWSRSKILHHVFNAGHNVEPLFILNL